MWPPIVEKQQRIDQLLAALLVALVVTSTCFTLAQGLPGGFLLDDHARIKHADVETLDIQEILHAVIETDSGVFGRVIPLVSLYASKVIHENAPGEFREQGIALHLITSLIVFWFSARILQSGRLSSTAAGQHPWIAAAIACGFWTLHPIQVSTALYIVQQMTQYAVLFMLLSMICYLAAREQLEARPSRAILPFGGFLLFFLLALLSKETAVMLPLLLLLVEWAVFGFEMPTHRQRLIHRSAIGVTCVLPVLIGLSYFAFNHDSLLHDYVMRPFTLGERLASEAVIVWQYVGMLLLPKLSSFSLYHDDATIYQALSIPVVISVVAWCALVVGAILARKTAPLFTFAVGFFVISHSLESTVLPLELAFEHRNYLASIGLALGVSGALMWMATISRFMRTTVLALVILLLSLLGLTQGARASAWSDPYTFAVLTAKENPGSSRALSTLANYQARQGKLDEARGLLKTAIEHQQTAESLSGLYIHLIMFHCYENEIPRNLIHKAHAAIQDNPVNSYTLTGLKGLRRRMIDGDCPALDRDTLLQFQQAAAHNPATRTEYRFFLNGMTAVTSTELGQYATARTYISRALEFRHAVSTAVLRDMYIVLAQTCIWDGDKQCAHDAIEEASRIDERIKGLIGNHPLIPRLRAMYSSAFGRDQTNSGQAQPEQ